MKNKMFYIFSPCVIAIILLSIGVFINSAVGGWRMLGVLVGLPFIAILAVAGIITKLLIRKNNGLLWVVEIILVVASFLILPNWGKA